MRQAGAWELLIDDAVSTMETGLKTCIRPWDLPHREGQLTDSLTSVNWHSRFGKSHGLMRFLEELGECQVVYASGRSVGTTHR